MAKSKKSRGVEAKKGKSKAARGATRSYRSVDQDVKRTMPWLRLFVASGAMALCAYVVYFVEWKKPLDKIAALANRPLSSVAIRGEFKRVSKDYIQDMVAADLSGSFIDIDLGKLKQAMEKNPWVAQAGIQRVWPDKLIISIDEERPIARWGDDAFINRNGEVIKIGNNQSLKDLPALFGGANQSDEITKKYVEMAKMLSTNGLALNRLYVDEKMSWKLTINNNLLVILGQGDLISRLGNFIYVYRNHLLPMNKEIESIDMRYSDALAVKWKEIGVQQFAVTE